MLEQTAQFRFYEELNDFFPAERRKWSIDYRFKGSPAIKDPIEALGVPHTEVDLIIVNGESVGFKYRLQQSDRVAVYPVFESFDISPLVKLRELPLRKTSFVVDVHLGKLARLLRLLGFDTQYLNNYEDAEIVNISVAQKRIILTRDRRLLFAKAITHGYWLRSMQAEQQVQEVLQRFDLFSQIKAFHRCLLCNGKINPVEKEDISHLMEPKTRIYCEDFFQCEGCEKIYWKGSHVEHMKKTLSRLLGAGADPFGQGQP